jgi:PiT family inorganic phosphate transporter
VVATKVLSPGQAVALAAFTNLIGAWWGTAVAKTIASGLIDLGIVAVTPQVLICALLGAVIWDLITWWWGLPSSSSHALVGGLCGAALAAAQNNWSSIIWWQGGEHWWQGKGLLPKVVLPMFSSPLLGFVLGFVMMGALFAITSWLGSRSGVLQKFGRPRFLNGFFGKMQMISASAMGLSHGMNDAQKPWASSPWPWSVRHRLAPWTACRTGSRSCASRKMQTSSSPSRCGSRCCAR